MLLKAEKQNNKHEQKNKKQLEISIIEANQKIRQLTTEINQERKSSSTTIIQKDKEIESIKASFHEEQGKVSILQQELESHSSKNTESRKEKTEVCCILVSLLLFFKMKQSIN